MDMKLVPMDDRIIVAPHTIGGEKKLASGIILPDIKEEQTTSGDVMAVGPGRVLDSGARSPMDVSEGDVVVFGKFSGTKIQYDGDEHLFLRSTDIMARVRP